MAQANAPSAALPSTRVPRAPLPVSRFAVYAGLAARLCTILVLQAFNAGFARHLQDSSDPSKNEHNGLRISTLCMNDETRWNGQKVR